MKKIKLFSATSPIPLKIEGEDVTDLSVNFYFVLNKTYGFTFLIDSPNLSCTDRNPIKLWKRFLIVKETEIIKYMRRWERTLKKWDLPEGEAKPNESLIKDCCEAQGHLWADNNIFEDVEENQ